MKWQSFQQILLGIFSLNIEKVKIQSLRLWLELFLSWKTLPFEENFQLVTRYWQSMAKTIHAPVSMSAMM